MSKLTNPEQSEKKPLLHHSICKCCIPLEMCKNFAFNHQPMNFHLVIAFILSTVLEFELRRAKETIKELRENITDYAKGTYRIQFGFHPDYFFVRYDGISK